MDTCNKKRYNVIYGVILLLMFVVFSSLFYCQAVRYNGEYPSDLPAHISVGLQGNGYSLLYFVISILYKGTGSFASIAMFESAMVMLTVFISAQYIKKHCSDNFHIVIVLAVSLIFLCSPYIPVLLPTFYKHGVVTQPWHNITYIGMRPFALLAYFATLNVLNDYQERFTWKNWLAIAIPLLISTSIKPNFLLTYCFALLFVLIFDFSKDIYNHRLDASRFIKYIMLGSVVFPSLAISLLQSNNLYGTATEPEMESGIAVVFLSSLFFSGGKLITVIKLIRDLTFPTVVWIYTRKSFNRSDKFAYLQFFITLVLVITLKETGPREQHGNFYWGMYMSAFILFLCTTSKFIKTSLAGKWYEKNKSEQILVCVGTILLLLHVFSGMVYFGKIFIGRRYMC